MPINDATAHRRSSPRRAAALALDYLHGGLATYLPGETFGPRVLRDFELVWIITGQVTYHADQHDHIAPPGSIILARPGFHETYHWDRRQISRHAYFHFLPAAVPADWPAVNDWPVLRTPAAARVIRPVFEHLLSSLPRGGWRDTPPRAAVRLVEVMLDAFLAGPLPAASEPGPAQPPAVRAALSWTAQVLHHDPARTVCLAELARAASVSPKHLCRLFTAHLGHSPVRCVRLLRLEQALALLARSNLSVKQIAHRCGFASPYHFSRCFHQAYGCPPTLARRQVAQGAAPPSGPLPIGAWIGPGLAAIEPA